MVRKYDDANSPCCVPHNYLHTQSAANVARSDIHGYAGRGVPPDAGSMLHTQTQHTLQNVTFVAMWAEQCLRTLELHTL
eukprot:1152079-Pelagomonas_calceolata.AAC.3